MHVKASIFIARPLQYRGGPTQGLWKKKGSRSLIKKFRDVTLCDGDGKVYGSHNRSAILDVVKAVVNETAMGSGLNGGACDAAHLFVSEILAHALKILIYHLFSPFTCKQQ